MNKVRFRDEGQSLSDFAGEFLVHCPQCDRRAQVIRSTEVGAPGRGRPRLVCGHCGYSKTFAGTSWTVGLPVDWYFRRPLWLRVACDGRELWAYNRAHVEFLDRYVRAELREEGTHTRPIRNATLASRLPAWIKSGRHRDEILKGLAKLRRMAE